MEIVRRWQQGVSRRRGRIPTEADHVLHDGARAEPHDQPDKGARQERDERLVHRLYPADLEIVGDPERENEEEEDEQD